jgi:phosphoribosylamine--glycine ligase
VARINSHLVTSGATGYVGVATGAGDSVNEAADRAYRLARKVIVPNLRFRTDIGEKVIRHDLAHLTELGYIG